MKLGRSVREKDGTSVGVFIIYILTNNILILFVLINTAKKCLTFICLLCVTINTITRIFSLFLLIAVFDELK